MTTIIQIPVIHNSSAYPWTTFFQIARFYRVIISIPRIKRLLVSLDSPWRLHASCSHGHFRPGSCAQQYIRFDKHDTVPADDEFYRGTHGRWTNAKFWGCVLIGLLVKAAQFLRGDIPMTSSTNNAIEMSFYQIFNAFLAVYQVSFFPFFFFSGVYRESAALISPRIRSCHPRIGPTC